MAWLGYALDSTIIESARNEADVTATVTVETAYPTLESAMLVVLLVITALSIVILIAKIPKKPLKIVCFVQLALALFNFVLPL